MTGPQDPPRTALQHLVSPWVRRHLRAVGTAHLAGGAVGIAAGGICLRYQAYGWAALFLSIGALNVGGGAWYLSQASSQPSPD